MWSRILRGIAVLLIGVVAGSPAMAAISGVSGPSFNLIARAGYLSTPDGGSVLMWGYGVAGGDWQYPGPTLIVNQGDTVTITLTNELSVPTSMVFPGQEGVVSSGGSMGALTREAAASGGTVTYTFVATHAGTYLYNSGTTMDLQVEMGLVGALIVRPNVGSGVDPAHHAYGHASAYFDREYLFLLTEIDKKIHVAVEQGLPPDMSAYFPTLWFINGRNGPDTLFPNSIPWEPNQPYSGIALMHPGEKMLMRVIGAGRDLHPFHHHGNHALQIARDGRLLESAPGAGADLANSDFTIKSVPGQTVDAIFEWTGKDLGWDIYGTGPEFAHDCVDTNADTYDDTTKEYCPDHGKPIPVALPVSQDLFFGGLWSGSPFLNVVASLPPGEGGLNPTGAFTYMWHSHTEKELTNDDIFPGGMMTMLLVVAPSVNID